MNNSDPGNAPLYNGKDVIVAAFRASNPSLYLWEHIHVGDIQLRDVLTLLDHVYQGQTDFALQSQILQDIILCRQHMEEQTSDHGQLSKYIHFATSITHIWVRFGKKTYDLMRSSTPIVCYLQPNVPINYAWFNFVNKKLILIKHTLPLREHPLKVMCHYLYKDDNKAMKMDEMRLAFELAKNEPMKTSKIGMFLQLSYVKDKDEFSIPKHGATSYCNFAIILTTGTLYRLQGVYYNDAERRKIHRLATLLHAINP